MGINCTCPHCPSLPHNASYIWHAPQGVLPQPGSQARSGTSGTLPPQISGHSDLTLTTLTIFACACRALGLLGAHVPVLDSADGGRGTLRMACCQVPYAFFTSHHFRNRIAGAEL